MTNTNPGAPDSGNYIQFDNSAPAADGSLVISVTWESTQAGNGHQPAVNAIQLVKVTPVVVQPNLGVTASAGNINISWAASANGFVLESTSALGSGATWAVVAGSPNPITGAGSINVNPAATGNSFYRLRK
jgi:hypothetical protein